ncbi:hypothetical protein [Streptomyces sp. DH12]|uniref:hypothetical protein n=1 Tax=Streptomyces sp. DH12 TaxID=2857010 RepID=UPI001E2EDBB2|nr:hypothetical protein [Streptomyces sp. DH12]
MAIEPDVLLAGVLGASVLAIVLLYRENVRHTQQINQLKADIVAQKIATALNTKPGSADPTATADLAPVPDEAPGPASPVRKKRHMKLYAGGGGVAAALVWLGDRISAAWAGHRGITATAAAVTVAVFGAATLALTTDGAAPTRASGAPGGGTPTSLRGAPPVNLPARPQPGHTHRDGMHTAPDGIGAPSSSTPPGYPLGRQETGKAVPTPTAAHARKGQGPSANDQGRGGSQVPIPPAPRPGTTPPTQTAPPPSSAPPTSIPDPSPDPSPEPSPQPSKGAVCFNVLPLLDLCPAGSTRPARG